MSFVHEAQGAAGFAAATCVDQKGVGSCEGVRHAELVFLVQVHEQIKGIARLSEDVSVAAMNASLVARGSEMAYAGFRAIAAELRVLSVRLHEDMTRLARVIAREVNGVAKLQYMRQRVRLLGPAANSHRQLAARVLELRAQMDTVTVECITNQQEIAAQLKGTRLKCKGGRVAARTALFEAAHAGAKAPLLMAAAREIEALVAALEAHTQATAELVEGCLV